MAIVYRHIRLDKNEPFYIGIGKEIERAYNKKDRSGFWKLITKKTDYEVQILFDDLTWEEACEKEKEFIALYGRKDLGTGILCNMTDGGDGTLGTKKDNIGEKNPMFGKSHSDYTKGIISNKAKNRYENKENHPMFGHSFSEESISKKSKSMKEWFNNNDNPWKGKKKTEDHINKYKKTVKERGSHSLGNNSKAIKFIFEDKIYTCLKELWLERFTNKSYRYWISKFDRTLIKII
jgi:hypothetical protein